MYDVTCRASFDSIGMWLREVDTYSTSRDTVKLLVGNKIDKVRSTWRELLSLSRSLLVWCGLPHTALAH